MNNETQEKPLIAESESDKRLAAAAPDLLAACKALIKAFGSVPPENSDQDFAIHLGYEAIRIATK